MSTCRACGAEVVFVPSAKSGRPMILNATPTKGIVVLHDHAYVHARGRHVELDGYTIRPQDGRGVAAVVDVFTDHHATCPHADRFRRRHGKPADPGADGR